MTRHAYFKTHDSECERFLSAPLWDDQNGAPISVMSGFARLGLEPWVEAVRLAGMSRAAAASVLVTNLSQLPLAGAASPHYASIAARLVELLPDRAIAKAQAVRPVRINISWVVAALLGTVVVLQLSGYF